jgi:hypothetical protein
MGEVLNLKDSRPGSGCFILFKSLSDCMLEKEVLSYGIFSLMAIPSKEGCLVVVVGV